MAPMERGSTHIRRRPSMYIIAVFAAVSLIAQVDAALVHSYWPAVGSYIGGTRLSVLLESPLSGQANTQVYCRFDSIIVFNANCNASAPDGPTVTFIAPPFIKGKQEVDVAFSVDAVNFETFGKFVYHEPLVIHSIAPAAGPTTGGDKVYVRFRNNDPFPAGFTSDEIRLLLEIECKFQNRTVAGRYEGASDKYPWLSVRCSTPPRTPGTVNLTVSLNGQEFTSFPGKYTYVTQHQLTDAEILASQSGSDPEAFTSWIDSQVNPDGTVSDFYNAFYGAAENTDPGYVFNATKEASSYPYYYTPMGKTASACMQSIYPSVGYSVATSTGVTITIRGSFPATTAKPPTCMFGTVTAPGFYSTTSGGNTTISCTAPAPDDRLSATVPLSFSVDGRNFSPAGANFTFYRPPTALKVVNVPAIIDKLEPFEAVIQLSQSPFHGSFAAYDQVAFSSSCKLDNRVTPAALFPPDGTYAFYTVRCFTNATGWGQKTLYFGFDGSNLFLVQTPLSFVKPSGVASTPVPSPDVGVPLFGLGNLLSLSPPQKKFTPVPSDDKYCVKYSTEPSLGSADLVNITLDRGSLSPTFSPGTQSYSVAGLDKSSLTWGFSVTPTAGATVTVDNLGPKSNGSTVYYQTNLTAGANDFTIRVTAPNGFTQKLYSIHVDVFIPLVLTNLTTSLGPLSPAFNSSVYDYSLTMSQSALGFKISAVANMPQATIQWGHANFDWSQNPPMVYPNNNNPLGVTIQPAPGTPIIEMCRNYSTSGDRALLPGGAVTQSWMLPGGMGFSQDPNTGLPTSSDVWVNCIGKTVVYVWVQQIDGSALLYTIAVNKGVPSSPKPALLNLGVMQGGAPPQPAYNISNPQNTIYSIAAASLFQQLVLTTELAEPVVSIRTVPDPVSLQYGHNNVTLVLTGMDYVSTARYSLDVFVRSSVLAGLSVQKWTNSWGGGYNLENMQLNNPFQGAGLFSYSANVDPSLEYVVITTFKWDPAAAASLACVGGCVGLLNVTDSTYLNQAQNSAWQIGGNTLNMEDWVKRMNVWVVGLGYGTNTVQVKANGSLGDSTVYSVNVTRPSPVPEDATLMQVSVRSADGSKGFGPSFDPWTQVYNVSIPKSNPNLLLSVATKDPAATVAMTVDGVPTTPSQISALNRPPAPSAQLLSNNLVRAPPQHDDPSATWQWALPFNVTPGVVKRIDFIVTSGAARSTYTYWTSGARGTDASLKTVGYYLADGTRATIDLNQFTLNGNQRMYSFNVPKPTLAMGFFATSNDPAAKVTIQTSAPAANGVSPPALNGSWVSGTAFSLGAVKTHSLFTLTATAEDGVSSEVFLVDVLRLAGSNSKLKSMNATFDGVAVPLDLTTNPIQVPRIAASTTSAFFSWASEDPDAVSKYSPDGGVFTPTTSATVPLKTGTTSFVVVIYSEDGELHSQYNIEAVVPINGTTLDALVPTPGLLSPPFSSSVYRYSLRLPSGIKTFSLNASATNPTSAVTLSSAGGALSSGALSADVGSVSVAVQAANGGPTATYTLDVIHLKDYEMLPYLDVTGSQQALNFTALPGSPDSDVNPGGLVTNAGAQVQFQIAPNCSRLARDFGATASAMACASLSDLTVRLNLVPRSNMQPQFTGNVTAVSAGTLRTVPTAAPATYSVQVSAAVCGDISGYCDPFKYRNLVLAQSLMVLPAIAISPQSSILVLYYDTTIDQFGAVKASFTPRDAYGNIQSFPGAVPFDAVVCPNSNEQNGSLCPVTNLTAVVTRNPTAAGLYDLTYVTHKVGTYRVVVRDLNNNYQQIAVGMQHVGLAPSTLIDPAQSTVVLNPNGTTLGGPNRVISIILTPKDQFGNPIPFMDDIEDVRVSLRPVNGIPGLVGFSATLGPNNGIVAPTIVLSVPGPTSAGSYEIGVTTRSVQINPSIFFTVDYTGMSSRSITDWSGLPPTFRALDWFAYRLQAIASDNQAIQDGGEAALISVAMCRMDDNTEVYPPISVCPTLLTANARVTDTQDGKYWINAPAYWLPGTYLVVTRVNGVPLAEGGRVITVVPIPSPPGTPTGTPGLSPPPPTPPGAWQPAPGPGAGPGKDENIRFLPGFGSVEVLESVDNPNGFLAHIRFNDTNNVPTNGLTFIAVLHETGGGNWYQFRSVPWTGVGTYSLEVRVPEGPNYELWVYACTAPGCMDVVVSSPQGALRPNTTSPMIHHDYLGPNNWGAPQPAPGPGHGNDDKILLVPGLGSVEILDSLDRPNGFLAHLRFNNTNNVPTSGLTFIVVLHQMGGSNWYQFRSVPWTGVGTYSLGVSVPEGPNYELWVYSCADPSCLDVVVSSPLGALRPNTTSPMIHHDYLGTNVWGAPQPAPGPGRGNESRALFFPGLGSIEVLDSVDNPDGFVAHVRFNDTNNVPANGRTFIAVVNEMGGGNWYQFRSAPWAGVGTYSLEVHVPPGSNYEFWVYACAAPDCLDVVVSSPRGARNPNTASPLIYHDYFGSNVRGPGALAPAPGPSGAGGDNGPKKIPGVGSIELLSETEGPTSRNFTFRFRDVTGVPAPGRSFVLLVMPAPGVATSAPVVPFYSAPVFTTPIKPAGDYAVNVTMRASGQYYMALYLCGGPSCQDVIYMGRVNSSASPIVDDQLSFPAGPLSPATTTVEAAGFYAVGVSGSFKITAKDSYGLVRSQVRDANRFNVTADHKIGGVFVEDRMDGTYNVRFIPLEAASYAVTAYIDRAAFATFNMQAIGNAGDATLFDLSGPSLGTAGQSLLYVVSPAVANYTTINAFGLSYYSTTPPFASGTISRSSCSNVTARRSPGCSFTFNQTLASAYNISVSLGPDQVKRSPLSVVVAPGPPSAVASKISVPSAAIPAGSPYSFFVQLVDKFGNPTRGTVQAAVISSTGAVVSTVPVTVTSAEPFPSPLQYLPTNKAVSQYSLTVQPLMSGTYRLRLDTQYDITGESVTLVSSNFTVKPGQPDVQNIIRNLQGSAIQPEAQVGSSLTLSAALYDSYNNLLTQSDFPNVIVSLSLALNGNVTVVSSATWNEGGTRLQVAPFNVTSAGMYLVSVSLGFSSVSMNTIYMAPIVVSGAAYAVEKTQVIATGNGTAGVLGTFLVQLRDTFGNVAGTSSPAASLFSGTRLEMADGTSIQLGPASLSVAPNTQPGLFTFTYRLTKSGQYSFKIVVASKDIPPVPTRLAVAAGESAQALAFGTGLSGGTVGQSRSVFVRVADAYGNIRSTGNATADRLAVIMTLTTGTFTKLTSAVAFQGPTFDPANSQYVYNYTAATTGLLTTTITLNGKVAAGSPYSGFVLSGPTSAAQSRLGGTGLAGSIEGVRNTITITAADSFGNVKTSGGDPFSARVLDTTCTPFSCVAYVSDNGDGTYTLSYIFQQAGTYQLEVTLNDQAVGTGTNITSPLKLTVLSATANRAIDLSKTSVSGSGLAGTVAGTAASFDITAVDALGIRLLQGGAVFTLQATPSGGNSVQSTPTSNIVDNGDGTYTVTYSTSAAGVYTLSLFSGNTPVTSLSGRTIRVLPGPSVASKTTLAGNFTPSAITAGQAVQASILPMDAYGNPVVYNDNYPASKDMFTLRITPILNTNGSPKEGAVTTLKNQTYQASAVLTTRGSYQLQILLAGQPIATPPTVVTVSPGLASPIRSSLQGLGLTTTWAAGIPIEVELYPYDDFNNYIDPTIATCLANFTSTSGSSTSIPCSRYQGIQRIYQGLPGAGTYTMTVTLLQNGSSVAIGSPQQIIVAAGAPFSKLCNASGPGVSTGGQAGQPTSFTVAVRDAYNNPVVKPTTVSVQVVNVATGVRIDGTVTSNNDGTLTATYTAASSGAHQVWIRVGDSFIGNGAPFSVTIRAALTSAAKTSARLAGSAGALASGVETAITAGQTTKLIVTAYDIYGQRQVDANGTAKVADQFTVTFGPPTAADGGATFATWNLVDNKDGTYTVFVSARKSAAASDGGSLMPVPYILAITLNSGDGGPAPIAGSPFQFKVIPATVDASASSVALIGSAETDAGLTSSFLLTTKDAYGNLGQYVPGSYYNITGTAVTNAGQVGGQGAVMRRLLDTSSGATLTAVAPKISVVNNYDGTYGLTLTTSQAGAYNVTIRVGGQVVRGGVNPGVTFTNHPVPAGKAKLSSFTASGSGIGATPARAGDGASQLIIQARDRFGNPTQDDLTGLASALSASFQVRVGSAGSFVTFSDANAATALDAQASSPGQLTLPFTAIKAGTLVTSLSITDAAGTVYVLQGSPYAGLVTPGDPSPPNCVASGPGLKGALACPSGTGCTPAFIYLTPKDANDNPGMDGSLTAGAKAALCARFGVAFSNAQDISAQPAQADNTTSGRCVLAYTAKTAADQNVAVTFDNQLTFGGGAFTLKVQPGVGAADPGQTAVAGDGINSVIVSGQASKLTVTLIDINGLMLPNGKSTQVGVMVTSQNGTASNELSITFADANNGQYVASFKPLVAGVFRVTISVNGHLLTAYPSGFTMTVAAAATDVLKTKVVVSPQSSVRIPQKVTVQIFPRDANNNAQDYLVSGQDAFSVLITQPDSSSLSLEPTLTQLNGVTYFEVAFPPLQVGGYKVQAFYSNPQKPELGLMGVGGSSNIISFKVTSGLPEPSKTELRGQGVTSAQAGAKAVFQIILKDAGGNRVAFEDLRNITPTAVVTSTQNSSMSVTAFVTLVTDYSVGNVHTATYFPIQSGDSVLDVYVLGQKLRFTGLTVSSGAVATGNCYATGPGVGTASAPKTVPAGTQSTFSIFARDVYKNVAADDNLNFQVKLTLLGKTTAYLNSDSITFADDHYEVDYTPVKAGTYSVSILRSGAAIGGGPYNVTVLPGETSASASKLSTGTDCVAGGTRVISLAAFDAFANPATSTSDSVYVSVTGTDSVSGQMTSAGPGLYNFSYPCLVATNQKSFLTVTLTSASGTGVVASRRPLTTKPGPVSPANIQVNAPASMTAGVPATLALTAMDAYNNQLWAGGLSFAVQFAKGTVRPLVRVTSNGDGTYQATLLTNVAGTYQLVANVSGQQFFPANGSTQSITVQPAAPVPQLTAVTFPSSLTAGAAGNFTVLLLDQFSNPVLADLVSTSNLQLSSVSSLSGASSPLASILTHDPSTGIYTVVTTPLAAGLIRLSLTVNQLSVLNQATGQLFSVPVSPGAVSAANCLVNGAGFTVGAASGTEARFFITANDANGNVVPTLPTGKSFAVAFSAGTLTAAITNQGNGIFRVAYVPTLAQVNANPSLTITVTYDGAQVATSAITLSKEAGAVAPASSKAVDANGASISSAVKASVGVETRFFIQPSDAQGLDIKKAGAENVFSAVVPNVGVLTPTPMSDGRYAVNFTSPVAGQLSVQLRSYSDSSVQLANSPVTVQVAPGATSAAAAKLFKLGGIEPFSTAEQRVAGTEDVILVKSFDAAGNAQVYNAVAGGDVYTAILAGPAVVQASLVDKQDGTYELHYTATVSGVYALTVSLRNPTTKVQTFVNAQPLQITVVNAGFDISQCSIRPAPAPSTTVLSAVPLRFTVVAKDGYGNPYNTGDKTFTVTSTGPAPLQCSLVGTNVSSEFQASCTAGAVGTYQVTVADTSDSTALVPGTPFQVVVAPGAVSSDTSSASGDSLTVGTAGQVASFVVTARDAAGNIVTVLPTISFTPKTAVDASNLQVIFTGCATDGTSCLASVTYTPKTYGNINITISVGSTVIGSFFPSIAPAPAPKMLGAQFSNLLNTLRVDFDSDTNLGGLQTVKDPYQTCQKLLDPSVIAKLGNANRFSCGWSSKQTLLITLGYNATIQPVGSANPDPIVLLPNAIGNAASNSYNASGSVPLNGPELGPTPVVSLSAPTSVGVCDPVTLSAGQSSGGGGRPLTFSYFVQGPNDDFTAALTQKLADYTTDGSYSSITLGATDLQPGTAYIFTVRATNFVGISSAPVAVTISKQNKPVPIVSTPGSGAEHRIAGRSNSILTAAASGQVPGKLIWVDGQCIPGGGDVPLKYQWQQLTGPIIDLSNLASQFAASFASPTLRVPGTALRLGYDYTFQVSVAVVEGGSLGQASTGQVTLSLIPQPITVSLVGGDRLVNSLNPLNILAIAKDPDNSADLYGNPYPFQYTWTCNQLLPDNATSALFQSDEMNNFGQQLIIPGSTMPDGVYTFTASVSKEPLATGRSNVAASAKITIATARVIAMGIQVVGADISGGITPSRNLVLSGSADQSNVILSWTLTSDTDARQLRYSVTPDGRMMIPPYTLLAGASYRVTLFGRDSLGIGSAGQASLTVNVQGIPSGGTVSLFKGGGQIEYGGRSRYQVTAMNWVKSADAPSGNLLYLFRYSVGGSGWITLSLGASNWVSFVPPEGFVVINVYILNPGMPPSAVGDQPSGAMYPLSFWNRKGAKRRSLLSIDEDETPELLTEVPEHFISQRSLLQTAPVDTTEAISSYENLFLPDAYQTADYLSVLAWAVSWGDTYAPPDPMTLGCGAGNTQMRTAKADVLKMIDVLDQSAPPAFSPGIDSGDGATIANQAACALASLLQVADEIPFSLLPANSTAGNATLSSTVAETQPAIESAIVTFLPKLQLIAQYGLATSPCGAANDTNTTCDDYRCFTGAADALLNVVARRCGTPNLPTAWWMDAAAFAPVLVARVYGNDPVVTTAGTATSFGGNTFDGSAVLAAVNATSIQATAGTFGFSVAIPDNSVAAYAIAYGHGILPPPGAPVSASGASSMAAALFLVKDNAPFAPTLGAITFANLTSLPANTQYVVDVFQATGCDLWTLPGNSSTGNHTTCVWSAAASNVSVSVDAASKTGTATVVAFNGIYVLHTMAVPAGESLVSSATATVDLPNPKTKPTITVSISNSVAVSASVVGATPSGALATDPITGLAVYYEGASQPVATLPASITPAAVAGVFFTQGKAAPGPFFPYTGSVTFSGVPAPAGKYVADVYHVSGCAVAMPPTAPSAYTGCTWAVVAQKSPVTYNQETQTAVINPAQAHWNGVFVLYSMDQALVPVPATPPPPPTTDTATFDPVANPVVAQKVGSSLSFSFATDGTAPITTTAVTFSSAEQVPVAYNLLPATPIVGAVALYLTQNSYSFAPESGSIAFENVPVLPATRRSLLAVTQYVVDVYTATGCTPTMPPTDATSFFGCTWTVDKDLPVTYDSATGVAIYTPSADHWNGLYLLHTATVDATPPPTKVPSPPGGSPPTTPPTPATPPPPEDDGAVKTGGDKSLAVGLGVGLGVGGALLVAAVASFVIIRRRQAAIAEGGATFSLANQ